MTDPSHWEACGPTNLPASLGGMYYDHITCIYQPGISLRPTFATPQRRIRPRNKGDKANAEQAIEQGNEDEFWNRKISTQNLPLKSKFTVVGTNLSFS